MPLPNRQSAQISLALLVAITVTLAMLILTLVLIAQSYRGLENAKLAAAEESAQQLAVNINDRIEAITAPSRLALSLLEHDPLMTTPGLPARLQRLSALAAVLEQNDIVSAVFAGYDNGEFFLLRQVTRHTRPLFPDAPPQTAFLLQARSRDGGSINGSWHYFDSNLIQLAEIPRPDYRYDPRNRSWYQQTTEPGRTRLSPPYVFFTTRDIGLTLSRRVAEGVIGIDVTVTALSHQLAGFEHTPSTRIGIVNADRQVIAYSRPEELKAPGPYPNQMRELDTLTDDTLAQISQLDPAQGMVPFDHQERTWFGLALPVAGLDDGPLRILLAIPADELLVEVWDSLAHQTRIAVAISMFLLVLGWFLGHQVGKPLAQLAQRVSALSQFRFDTPVRVNSRILEASRLSSALEGMAGTIRSFQNIALTLNRGRNLEELLDDVLAQILHIIGQQQGAIYLYAPRQQRLNLAVNAGMPVPAGVPDIDVASDDSDLVRHLRPMMPGHPLIAVLRNRRQDLVGVLVIDMANTDPGKLSDDLVIFVEEIAGSAAVAIETRELIESQQAMLDGIIRLVANAIDAKSPYTSGHCERVPQLAQRLLDAAVASDQPPFRDFQMSEDEAYEFKLAAWLHDCGKITSPEYVVDKATKLETIHNRIHEIRTRFEVLHRDAEIQCLRRQLAGVSATDAERQRDREQARLQQEFAQVATANIGGEAMSDEAIAQLQRIAGRTWQRHFSDRLGLSRDEIERLQGQQESALPATETLLADRPEHLEPWGERLPPVTRDDPRNRWGFDMPLPAHAYNRGELHNLTVRRGTLTPEERFKINEHIVQTICMLDALPLPDRLANVPRLAGTHHERLDGEGYPCRLDAAALGIPERIMAVADIFEALTAADRPYKDGKTLTESLSIMVNMANERHIDAQVLELFIESGVYRQYAEACLSPGQIDTVDEAALVSRLAK
ncbi:HD domain-containing phosphohydrolase [Marinobacter sp. CA1]|uniref:HD domain-containing phosphohydrolase n=1 Tax=Marinobacter sp. CA1 TaxID=2817656 RepID=UPI001D0825BF|nr:HD domain-containing phosphohydrolase [Marinobacter sp. CA1]